MKHPKDKQPTWAAVDELVHLYEAWLSLLLLRLNAREIRVSADELSHALAHMRCTVSKEAYDYVIRMAEPCEADLATEVRHEAKQL